MNWNETYLTGADDMDQDHKAIFELVNDYDNLYREANKPANYEAEYIRILKEIHKYSKKHFLIEESFMEAYSPSGLSNYIDQNQYFLTLLGNYTEKLNALILEKKTVKTQEQLKLVRNDIKSRTSIINKLLKTWLVKHITEDHPKFNDMVSISSTKGKISGIFSMFKLTKS